MNEIIYIFPFNITRGFIKLIFTIYNFFPFFLFFLWFLKIFVRSYNLLSRKSERYLSLISTCKDATDFFLRVWHGTKGYDRFHQLQWGMRQISADMCPHYLMLFLNLLLKTFTIYEQLIWEYINYSDLVYSILLNCND